MSRDINKQRSQEIFQLALGPYLAYEPSPSTLINTSLLDVRLPVKSPHNHRMLVQVENTDTISAIMSMPVGRTMVLNMANDYVPGGGYINGAMAQEEDLFRRTNLFRTLTSDLYPMSLEEAIYTNKAHVLRDSQWNNLAEPKTVSFISIAAMRQPPLRPDGSLTDEDYETMRAKIRLIFHVGALNRIDHLVLGALGCGVFQNPPEDIVVLFRDTIHEYRGYFRSIKFAVLSSANNPNYTIFQRGLRDI